MDNINIYHDGEKIPEVLLNFLVNEQSVKGHSINTIIGYKSDLVEFLKYTKKQKKSLKPSIDEINFKTINKEFIKSITYNDAMKFLNYITYEKLDKHGKIKGDGESTRARKVNAIKSFFLYLEITGIISSNPMFKLVAPKIGERTVVYLNVDESKSLLNSVKEYDGEFRERDYCIITLFVNCGLRLSELVSVNLNSIKGSTLTVIGKGNKERDVPLTNACLHAIENYLPLRPDIKDIKGEPMFISKRMRRISKESVGGIVKKYVNKAGLDSKVTAHKLRHTAASLMYKGNKNLKALQEILGHKNITTTQIYTHIEDQSKRDTVNSNPLANEI
jgi:site-specific recombinase XerD